MSKCLCAYKSIPECLALSHSTIGPAKPNDKHGAVTDRLKVQPERGSTNEWFQFCFSLRISASVSCLLCGAAKLPWYEFSLGDYSVSSFPLQLTAWQHFSKEISITWQLTLTCGLWENDLCKADISTAGTSRLHSALAQHRDQRGNTNRFLGNPGTKDANPVSVKNEPGRKNTRCGWWQR